MIEAQLFEALGRKQVQLEEIIQNYSNLVAIVRGIKDGSVDLARLTIAPNGIWTLAPENPKEQAG